MCYSAIMVRRAAWGQSSPAPCLRARLSTAPVCARCCPKPSAPPCPVQPQLSTDQHNAIMPWCVIA